MRQSIKIRKTNESVRREAERFVMNTKNIGTFYEDSVYEYLKEQGIRILEQNFRCRQGEIDIIGRWKDCLIFFEVKYRKADSFGGALGAVDFRKQKKICRCADYYCMLHSWNGNLRYDVIGITDTKIEWIKDAFSHIGYHWS